MDVAGIELRTEVLDHHGIVAGICDELCIVERINKRIGSTDPRRVIQPGVSVKAMVINGLGFTNRRLYLTPQFFESKALNALFDEPITAEQLDDHALGKCLDEISAYGETRLFGEIALEIAIEKGLLGPTGHLDTTSFSLTGAYETEDVSAIEVKHGFSKDHRPDLKQVMLSMVCTGPANLPIWLEPQNGNSSDKTTFQETLQRIRMFQEEMNCHHDFVWVADSAFYTTENLRAYQAVKWISRVPETLSCCRELVEKSDDAVTWEEMAGGYKYTEVSSDHGGVQQRWLLVSSEQAFARESETFEKNLTKTEASLKKLCVHQSNQIFNCPKDAEQEIERLCKKSKFFHISAEIKNVEKHESRGRPKAGAQKKHVGYQIVFKIERNDESIKRYLRRKGRFVLATNELDSDQLSSVKILSNYKGQQSVEGGFRFLKDPWFMVDSFFVKKRSRIGALMFVMGLSLLVYNFAQQKLREALVVCEKTIPNQKGKPIQNPTMRWIFQLMEGIGVVKVLNNLGHCIHRVISNLTDVRKTIISLLGPKVCLIYGIKSDFAGM
jgi:transposase